MITPTERRNMAIECLAALLSNPQCEPEDCVHNAKVAVRNVDALLLELTKEKED